MQASCGQGACRSGRESCRSANAKAGYGPTLCRKGHACSGFSTPLGAPSDAPRDVEGTPARGTAFPLRFVPGRRTGAGLPDQRSVVSFFAPSLGASLAPPTVTLMVWVTTLPSVPLISTVTSSAPVKPALLS
jgi:hypothetical protein